MYTNVRPSGESLKNSVALLWVEVGQPCNKQWQTFGHALYAQDSRDTCHGTCVPTLVNKISSEPVSVTPSRKKPVTANTRCEMYKQETMRRTSRYGIHFYLIQAFLKAIGQCVAKPLWSGYVPLGGVCQSDQACAWGICSADRVQSLIKWKRYSRMLSI
jgi:hypothetical protein